jgi:hypothetical protein
MSVLTCSDALGAGTGAGTETSLAPSLDVFPWVLLLFRLLA